MLRFFALLAVILFTVACGGGTVAPTTPAAPTGVTATPGPGYVTLSWQDNSNDETGFVIYRDPAPSAGLRVQAEGKLAEVGANVAEYLDRDIEVGVEYRYRVAARNAQGESAASAGSQDAARVGIGVDLMVGTNNRRYSETDNGTIFVVYFMFPEAVLGDESVVFEGSITGPAGWNGGAPLTFSRSHFARMRGFTFLTHNAITAVAGTYTLSLSVGDETYTATDSLDDAMFKLPRPTTLQVTEHGPTQVTVTWTPPVASLSSFLRLFRGNYQEFIKGGMTTESAFTFTDLELTPGSYFVEVAPINVDYTEYPIRINPFGISYDTVNFSIAQPESTFYKVDPAGAYLPRHPDDPANPATAVSLAALGVSAGECLSLVAAGDYAYGLGVPDNSSSMTGVFRGPAGFVAPGPGGNHQPVTTDPLPEGTDIPEDFNVAGGMVALEVPAGATEILFAPDDSFHYDNSDPDGDYGVYIALASCP